MRSLIENLIDGLGMSDLYSVLTVNAILILIILLAGSVAYYLAKRLLNLYSHKIAEKTATTFDDLLIEKGVFRVLARIAPALTFYLMLPMVGDWAVFLEEVIISLIILFIVIALFRVLDVFVDSVKGRSKTKAGPLKGIVQVMKIALGIVAGLLIVVTFMGQNRGWAVFSSIGGLSAVLLLIFRDSILGFVAGVQLSADGLLKLGDWLEMSKFDADGEVVDISLTKVTVRNWDKTYTSIPAYKFLEESFKNWEGMSLSGGRRIKRSISIDMNTIGFLTDAQLQDLNQIDIMKAYFISKEEALSVHNSQKMGKHPANRRQLTNIGTFRAYVTAYLKNHPDIHQGMTLMARQLSPVDTGVPIEIYCFTNTTVWVDYEGIQADVFDHFLAILPAFGLKPYQKVSGEDLHNFKADLG